MITGLISAFTAEHRRRPAHLRRRQRSGRGEAQRGRQLRRLRRGARGAAEAGLDPATADALVENYEDAQLKALKIAFLFAAFLVLASFWTTRRLPTQRFDELQAGPDPPLAEPVTV